MATSAILILIGACLLVFALANAFLWFAECIATLAKYLVCFIFSKPCDFKQDYFKIRLFVTHIMLYLAFAMLSPRQIVQHQDEIKSIQNHKLEKKYYKYSKKAKKIEHKSHHL